MVSEIHAMALYLFVLLFNYTTILSAKGDKNLVVIGHRNSIINSHDSIDQLWSLIIIHGALWIITMPCHCYVAP